MREENQSAGTPGRGFPRRVYPARAIGVGLGFISVAGVFSSAGAPPWAWLLLILNGFVWPHIAFLSARRAADPRRAEQRNLMIDALGGGFWVAMMQFNLLPSALLLAMLSMDNIALGGMGLFLRGLLAHLAGVAAGVLLVGWAPAPARNTVLSAVPADLSATGGYHHAPACTIHRTARSRKRQWRRASAYHAVAAAHRQYLPGNEAGDFLR